MLVSPVIAIHIRDEERLMEKHTYAVVDEDDRFIRFGAFRDVFSAQELFGAKSRSRLLRAVLLKKLYDTVYDIRAKVVEKTADEMIPMLISDKENTVEAFPLLWSHKHHPSQTQHYIDPLLPGNTA